MIPILRIKIVLESKFSNSSVYEIYEIRGHTQSKLPKLLFEKKNQNDICHIFIPFSERKGLEHKNVCLSKPIRNELLYFSVLAGF